MNGRLFALAAALALIGCPGTTSGGLDASVEEPAGADAGLGLPDAAHEDPDASTDLPDAALGSNDAGAGEDAGATPDAGTPDAGSLRCEGAPPPNSSGETCEATAGTNGKVLLVGTVLAAGEVREGGQVLVDEEGRIECVGCDCRAGAAGATVVQCPDAVVSPGLIDAHQHLTYANSAPKPATEERYEHRHQWRLGLSGHTKLQFAAGDADSARLGELRMVLAGTTSAVSMGGQAGFVRNLDQASSLREGLQGAPVSTDNFPLGDTAGTTITSGCGYSPREPSWTALDAYLPHLGEGIGLAAHNELVCGSGAGSVDFIRPQTAVVDGIAASAAQVGRMASTGARLVWSPRSNVRLYGDTASVPLYARMGVLIALSTDWLPTGSMNMLRELQCASALNETYFDHSFSDEELWKMATVNAARATATEQQIGSIAPGLQADLVVFARKTRAPYRAVIDATPGDVALVLRGGVPLYGDASVLAALPQTEGCEALQVCGVEKTVCVQPQIGVSLAALLGASSNQNAYPLYVCEGTPPNEPTCVPRRSELTDSVGGSNLYDGIPSPADADGDGLPDALDNCPRSFNPIRPMDGAAQADADGDGVGDPCDPCPLVADSTACARLDSDDEDGDGVPSVQDVCPSVADPLQLDSDGDRKGDLCDSCPEIPNAGTLPCPTTIYAVQRGLVPLGSQVRLDSTLVTAVGPRGFFVQVKETDSGYEGPDHSGIYVVPSVSPPEVRSGDRVSLLATASNYYGARELEQASYVVLASDGEGAPAPVEVEVADVQTGGPRASALEGVLVRVRDLTVSDANPPAASGEPPDAEFAVRAEGGGELRVHDLFYSPLPPPIVGESFSALTGILRLDFGLTKLEPRGPEDCVQVFPAAPPPP